MSQKTTTPLIRRLLRIILPALLLLGMVQLSRAAATWRYVVPDAPDTLLYATSFEGENAADEWDTFEGRMSAQLVQGVLRVDVDAPDDETYSPLRWTLRDFDVTVRATAVEGSDNNGFGVVFRRQDLQNYYFFLISSDGYYSLQRVINNTSQLLTDWTASPAINLGIGEANTLRVTGQGTDYQFYINGELMQLCLPENLEGESTYNTDGSCMGVSTDTLTDPTLTEGNIGLMAKTIRGVDGAVAVEFDDVVIYSPPTEWGRVLSGEC